jgi:hypothetical protein
VLLYICAPYMRSFIYALLYICAADMCSLHVLLALHVLLCAICAPFTSHMCSLGVLQTYR